MSKAVLSRYFYQEIKDILGLPKGVKDIKLTMASDECVTIEVKYYPDHETLSCIFEEIRKYELVERVKPTDVTSLDSAAKEWTPQ